MAAEILEVGKLKIGPSQTSEKIGIYCEGESRKSCTVPYAAHVIEDMNPPLLVACVLELCVNRKRGGTIHDQWFQKDEDSVFITGIYTHLVQVTKFFGKGFKGWYCWDESVKAFQELFLTGRTSRTILQIPEDDDSEEFLSPEEADYEVADEDV